MQPNGVGVPGDEFVDGQAVDQLRARNPLLLSVDEDRHVIPLSLAPRSPFRRRKFAFPRCALQLPLGFSLFVFRLRQS
jgi:hypothetical protein